METETAASSSDVPLFVDLSPEYKCRAEAEPFELSERERALLRKLFADQGGVTVTRKSAREFDLGITGPGFRAWLPLAAIREMDWTSSRISAMTDYPEMAASGDWSGVRDSSNGAKWSIFGAEIDAFLSRRGKIGHGR